MSQNDVFKLNKYLVTFNRSGFHSPGELQGEQLAGRVQARHHSHDELQQVQSGPRVLP